MTIKKITMMLFMFSLLFVLSGDVLAGKSNKQKAQEHCDKIKKQGKDCKLSRLRNCGPKWKRVKRYRGRGKNYTVCERGSRLGEKKNWKVKIVCQRPRMSKRLKKRREFEFKVTARTKVGAMAKAVAKAKISQTHYCGASRQAIATPLECTEIK